MHQVVPGHTYLFWVKCYPSRTFPQRSLSGNPRIDPPFLFTVKPHPLNTLTYGLPPMYWLGTSRWCLGPLCMLHFVCVCFFLAFRPFLLLLRCLILLYVLVCVYPLWREGCVGFWTHVFFLLSFPRLDIDQAKAFSFISYWAHALVSLLHGHGPFNH